MVKKLLQQRRHTGNIAPRHRFAGRKPMIGSSHRAQMRALLTKKSDLTLRELRQHLSLRCSVQAIHVVLIKMGLTYKKRLSAPANKTGRTSRGRANSGGGAKAVSIRPS